MDQPILTADLAVIGAGSGGLSVAAGAAQLGLDVVLFEKGEMGGDCLNAGCVPSKALIAAATAAHEAREAARLGVLAGPVAVDFAAVMAHVRGAIAAIAPHDSEDRFTGLGVRVVREAARFVDPRTVASDSLTVRARRIVLATGSRPLTPPIPGLDGVPWLSNETVFGLDVLPGRLVVLGGGPVGIELGQAFRRLGSEVVIVESGAVLGREEPAAAAVVRDQLRRDGVELYEGWQAVRAERGPSLVLRRGGDEARVSGTHLLLAAGRRPALDGLGLERAGVRVNAGGVVTDRSLRSSNRRIYAVGDVAGRGQFTHLAGAHAALVIRRAVFGLAINADALQVPRVTYCDPEVAAIGLTEAQARQAHGDRVRVETFDLAGNDRAVAEGDARGFGKLVTTARGRVLGVTLVGRHAGEHIHLWALALSAGLGLGRIAGAVAPYPTRAEVSKRLAGQWYAPALFSGRTRALVSILKRRA